jgi:hypothetical protein
VNLPERWSFQGATVARFFRANDSVRLEMKDVDDIDETGRFQVAVEVFGVHRIEVDHQSPDTDLSDFMAAESGEVLTLEHSANELYVIIEWHNYSPRRTFIHAYRVHGDRVRVSVI